MAYTNTYRYTQEPTQGGFNQLPYREIQNPTYAATIALIATDYRTEKMMVDVGLLTGALTMTADLTLPCTGDELTLIFKSDGTGRVVTFSTGFIVNTTLTLIASKSATVSFVFSGQANAWVEKGRFIQT